MPCPPIRISLGICHLGDRRMRPPPLIQRPRRYAAARTSGCRNRTRAPNSHSPASSAGTPASTPNPVPLGGPPDDGGLTERVGRRDEQQAPGLLGQRREPATETVLNPV